MTTRLDVTTKTTERNRIVCSSKSETEVTNKKTALEVLCYWLLTDMKHLMASLRQQSYLFTEIWRYIDFQNGGRLPSWNCFITIQDHPRSLCCWPQLPVKFHVNLIHRSKDIPIRIFHIFGLQCLFRPPKWGFWGTLNPWMWLFIIETPKRPWVNPRLLSYQL